MLPHAVVAEFETLPTHLLVWSLIYVCLPRSSLTIQSLLVAAVACVARGSAACGPLVQSSRTVSATPSRTPFRAHRPYGCGLPFRYRRCEAVGSRRVGVLSLQLVSRPEASPSVFVSGNDPDEVWVWARIHEALLRCLACVPEVRFGPGRQWQNGPSSQAELATCLTPGGGAGFVSSKSTHETHN